MGISTDNDHTWLSSLPTELGVHDGILTQQVNSAQDGCRQDFTYIHPLKLTQLEVMLGSIASFNEIFYFGSLHDPRINHMVTSKPETIIAEDAWSSKLIIYFLQALCHRS
jgi:hypothetical protein